LQSSCDDANGNLTGDGTNSYTFEGRNHLTAIGGSETASFVGACPEPCRRDPFGRRATKVVNSTTAQLIGACPERSRRNGLDPVQLLNGSNPPGVTANLMTGLRIDEYFRTSAGGGGTYMVDALGSTIGLVNSSGTIAGSYTYQPFGKSTAGGTATTPFQFTGRENDGTGLYYYRARY